MEILWEEEGFQFGFKRWQGWAVSKVLWERIPNVGSKIRDVQDVLHCCCNVDFTISSAASPPAPPAPLFPVGSPSIWLRTRRAESIVQSSGAVWKSRWMSWTPVPKKPYGFCGRKATLQQQQRLSSIVLRWLHFLLPFSLSKASCAHKLCDVYLNVLQ